MQGVASTVVMLGKEATNSTLVPARNGDHFGKPRDWNVTMVDRDAGPANGEIGDPLAVGAIDRDIAATPRTFAVKVIWTDMLFIHRFTTLPSIFRFHGLALLPTIGRPDFLMPRCLFAMRAVLDLIATSSTVFVL